MKYPDRKIEHLHLLGKLFTSNGGVWFDFLFKLFWNPIITFTSGKTLRLWNHSCMYRRRTKPYGWWCLLSVSDLTLWGWLLSKIDFQCWVLGMEKVEKQRRKRNDRAWLCFFFFFLGFYWGVFIGFSKRFFFLCLFYFFGFRNFFLNTVLTWKIVGASKVSVVYIYIDNMTWFILFQGPKPV